MHTLTHSQTNTQVHSHMHAHRQKHTHTHTHKYTPRYTQTSKNTIRHTHKQSDTQMHLVILVSWREVTCTTYLHHIWTLNFIIRGGLWVHGFSVCTNNALMSSKPWCITLRPWRTGAGSCIHFTNQPTDSTAWPHRFKDIVMTDHHRNTDRTAERISVHVPVTLFLFGSTIYIKPREQQALKNTQPSM